jgi:hypothetical protein
VSEFGFKGKADGINSFNTWKLGSDKELQELDSFFTGRGGNPPVNVVAPVISGTTSLGSVLTTTDGTWTGNTPITYTYQWQRNGSPISSATSSTYTIVAADSAANITCVVTATNAFGSSSATSNTITAQTFTAPINTVAPVVSGGVLIGQTLTTTNGTWTANPSSITYTYQWQRNGSPILGETSSTYLLVYADVGTNVRCVVTATNAIGSASANSNQVAVASFDTDYQAILNKGTSLGYTLPTDSVKLKQNTLLTSIKVDGIWAKLDVFYVFAQDGSAEFATLNWKNPNANQANITSAPTFVVNGGFQGNGTSSYIDTTFNPATQGVNYTLNNASRYFFTHAISGGNRFDGNSTTGSNSIVRASTTFQRINSGASGNLATAFDFTATVNTKSIHRTSSTNVTLFNSTTGSSTTETSTALPSLNQWILSSGSTFAAHTCAAYAMGASLVAENTNFVNDWNTYKNSL